MTAEDVLVLLRERYSDRRRYVFVEEVQLGKSTVDAVVLHCYLSDRYELAAFEIKVSRSDWLRELRDPVKNSKWRREAGSFSYVAAAGVILPGEVPDGLGWMVSTSESLRWRTKPKRDPFNPKMTMPLEAAAMIARIANGYREGGKVSRERAREINAEADATIERAFAENVERWDL